MTSTIKLRNFRAVTVKPDGQHIKLTVSVGNIPAFSEMLTVEEMGALLAACEGAATEAETYRRALAVAAQQYAADKARAAS